MLRSTLVASVAALTALLGAGTATAATPAPSLDIGNILGGDGGTCTVAIGDTTCLVQLGNGHTRTCTIAVSSTAGVLCTLPDSDHHGDNRNRDRDRRGVCNGHNVCNGGPIIDPGPILPDNGDCITYVNDSNNSGRLYNQFTTDRNRLLAAARDPRSTGGRSVTSDELRRINAHDNDRHVYRGNYNRSVGQLRTICNQQPQVTIVNEAPESTQTTITQVAPAPVLGGGQVQYVPRGSSDAGDGSTLIQS